MRAIKELHISSTSSSYRSHLHLIHPEMMMTVEPESEFHDIVHSTLLTKQQQRLRVDGRDRRTGRVRVSHRENYTGRLLREYPYSSVGAFLVGGKYETNIIIFGHSNTELIPPSSSTWWLWISFKKKCRFSL